MGTADTTQACSPRLHRVYGPETKEDVFDNELSHSEESGYDLGFHLISNELWECQGGDALTGSGRLSQSTCG